MTIRWRPLIGSLVGERVKGRGVKVWGSRTWRIVRERVSRERGPAHGDERVRRAAAWMVEEGKSK